MNTAWFIYVNFLFCQLSISQVMSAYHVLSFTYITAENKSILTVEVSHSTFGHLTERDDVQYIDYTCLDQEGRIYYWDRKYWHRQVNKHTFGPIRSGKEYIIDAQLVSSNRSIVTSVNQTYYLASQGFKNFSVNLDSSGNQLIVQVEALPYSLYGNYEIKCEDLTRNKTGAKIYTATLDTLLHDRDRNLALGKQSRASSRYLGRQPKLGNNGNIIDSFRTESTSTPHWWLVNLENSYQIGRIEVFGDPLCSTLQGMNPVCTDPISDLFLLTATEQPGDPDPSSKKWSSHIYIPKLNSYFNVIPLNNTVRAQYVALYSNSSTTYLRFAEVRVFELARYSVALQKSTKTSSGRDSLYSSGRAVNGIAYLRNDYSATQASAYSWWSVDLEKPHKVESMEIYPTSSMIDSVVNRTQNEFYIQTLDDPSMTPCTEQDRQDYQENYYANNFVYPVTRVLFVPMVTTPVLAICSLLNLSLQLHEVKVFQGSSKVVERTISTGRTNFFNAGMYECVLSSAEKLNSAANLASTLLIIEPVAPIISQSATIVPTSGSPYVQITLEKANYTDYYTELEVKVKDSSYQDIDATVIYNHTGPQISNLIFGLNYFLDLTVKSVYENREIARNERTNINIDVAPLPPKDLDVSFNFEESTATVTVTNYPLDMNYINFVYLNISPDSRVVRLSRIQSLYVWKDLKKGVGYTFEAWTQSDVVEELSQKISVEKIFKKDVISWDIIGLFYSAVTIGSISAVVLIVLSCHLHKRSKKQDASHNLPVLPVCSSHLYEEILDDSESERTFASGNKHITNLYETIYENLELNGYAVNYSQLSLPYEKLEQTVPVQKKQHKYMDLKQTPTNMLGIPLLTTLPFPSKLGISQQTIYATSAHGEAFEDRLQ